MYSSIKIIDFGCKQYEETLEMQRTLFHDLINKKKLGESSNYEYLLIGEHTPVITCGKHANPDNILINKDLLKSKKIDIFNIERGGDVTFHGPGQMIAYPIIDLTLHSLGVKKYVQALEECVILLLSKYDIKGERIEGAPGVWIDKGSGKERKICAIGVKCSHFCTMHGLALNVNTDLDGFSLINPCGFIDKGVTSLAQETGEALDIEKVKKEFSDIFLRLIFPL